MLSAKDTCPAVCQQLKLLTDFQQQKSPLPWKYNLATKQRLVYVKNRINMVYIFRRRKNWALSKVKFYLKTEMAAIRINKYCTLNIRYLF